MWSGVLPLLAFCGLLTPPGTLGEYMQKVLLCVHARVGMFTFELRSPKCFRHKCALRDRASVSKCVGAKCINNRKWCVSIWLITWLLTRKFTHLVRREWVCHFIWRVRKITKANEERFKILSTDVWLHTIIVERTMKVPRHKIFYVLSWILNFHLDSSSFWFGLILFLNKAIPV